MPPRNSISSPVALTLWDRTTGEGYQPFVDAWLPKFNEKHRGKIELRYEPRPDDWGPKLTTAISRTISRP